MIIILAVAFIGFWILFIGNFQSPQGIAFGVICTLIVAIIQQTIMDVPVDYSKGVPIWEILMNALRPLIFLILCSFAITQALRIK